MSQSIKTPNIEKKPSSLRYYQEGPPKSIDLNTWRLSVTGYVKNELKLTYNGYFRFTAS
ncbi:DMSO/TMAO reductase YedYZ molybdopterin-dependent catalytic subunit [Scopulibacillus daqui]|uniref:DMSO/TMAO reductase YedYZ molybdopterin-dependent catalytic subunit n=1 Tax=Scopulibacillus daqui TaxID=1469162 RepID=A0ABS2PX19_9BACL|nr:hypothetical protein [Scopulibacillus daqui]MBM7644582.1 DMSO/TMAO reductase YedYZ molybdopterin-dependent catalytic subunit [Scopulibacillus daqui]